MSRGKRGGLYVEGEEGDQLLFEVVQGHEARMRVVKRGNLLDLYDALRSVHTLASCVLVRYGSHMSFN
jgi:hypothetical protein